MHERDEEIVMTHILHDLVSQPTVFKGLFMSVLDLFKCFKSFYFNWNILGFFIELFNSYKI